MTTEPHAALPPVVGSRPLTTRELGTIRAALRLWVELDDDDLSDDALAVAHAEILNVGQPGDVILGDNEIEQLIVDLALAGDVIVTRLNVEGVDARRI